ncbi:MAG: hypothetical protein ACE15B_07975 [Bryobacteraceae bacterium]
MRRGRRGNSILETMLWLPFILLLLVGMVQVGKVTYIYYTLKKTVYSVATQIAASQGVDFCNNEDPAIVSAKALALSGSVEIGAESTIPSLTADMLQVDTECVDPGTNAPGPCNLGSCDSPGGQARPDYIVVSIPNGFEVPLRFPYMLVDPILLRPQVRVPFGGT